MSANGQKVLPVADTVASVPNRLTFSPRTASPRINKPTTPRDHDHNAVVKYQPTDVPNTVETGNVLASASTSTSTSPAPAETVTTTAKGLPPPGKKLVSPRTFLQQHIMETGHQLNALQQSILHAAQSVPAITNKKANNITDHAPYHSGHQLVNLPLGIIKEASESSMRSRARLTPGSLRKMRSQGKSLGKSGSVRRIIRSSITQRRHNFIVNRKDIPAEKHSLAARAAYFVDTFISSRKGQTLALAILGTIFLLVGSLFLYIVRQHHYGDRTWQAWSYLVDPGSHVDLTDAPERVIGMIMTLVGILYFSVIMGFVVDGIRDKMDSLKRGKSSVAEEKHTLMLGWTDKSISLIRQICLANESEKGGVIVVLAEMEKEELENELNSHLDYHELRGTDIVFRTGTPLLSVDLLKVAAHRAKSIIIMANSGGDADRSDASVLRTVLSLKSLPELIGHIVAELRDIDNAPLLRLIGGDQVDILVSHDVIGRLVLTAARSPGLAEVFSSLLGFEGNEFYLKEWPECVGVRFDQLLERFPNAVPLGIKTAEGEVIIRPPNDLVLRTGDEVIVLAEDDDTYKACPPAEIDAGILPSVERRPLEKEKILMCGWRRDIRDMIQLLDDLVAPGTELHMLCEQPVKIRNKLLQESGLGVDLLRNLQVVHHYGNTAIRRHLETVPLHTFTSMMILADQSREADIMHSDSHSLASLLLLRDMQKRMMVEHSNATTQNVEVAHLQCKCISEILDPRTQKTISTSTTILGCSEFIQSNELVSCMLAMISESREVRVILEELLGPDGSTFSVESSTRYCNPSERVTFWQLAKRAISLGEILCGFQIHGTVDETVLNPPGKNEPRFWAGVELIILRPHVRTAKVFEEECVPVTEIKEQELTKDFEKTSRSRMSKQSMVRYQILEAFLQECKNAEIDEVDMTSIDPLQQAINAYRRASASGNDNTNANPNANPNAITRKTRSNSIKGLIAATRGLLDALEKKDTIDEDEEVEEYT